MTPRFETSKRMKEISSAVIFFPDTNAREKENMFIWCDWHKTSALREHNHLSLFTAKEKDKELLCDSRGTAFIIKHSLPRNWSTCILETNKNQDWEKYFRKVREQIHNPSPPKAIPHTLQRHTGYLRSRVWISAFTLCILKRFWERSSSASWCFHESQEMNSCWWIKVLLEITNPNTISGSHNNLPSQNDLVLHFQFCSEPFS